MYLSDSFYGRRPDWYWSALSWLRLVLPVVNGMSLWVCWICDCPLRGCDAAEWLFDDTRALCASCSSRS